MPVASDYRRPRASGASLAQLSSPAFRLTSPQLSRYLPARLDGVRLRDVQLAAETTLVRRHPLDRLTHLVRPVRAPRADPVAVVSQVADHIVAVRVGPARLLPRVARPAVPRVDLVHMPPLRQP